MGINVINWQQADAAVAGMEDGATKAFVSQILPAVKATTQVITDHIQDRFDASLGNALSAVTAERTEALTQALDGVHSILDRVNWPGVILPRKS
jgi:hypothetical protein